MTRLLPRAFTGFCLLSLLACAATGWLWGHSRRSQDHLRLRLPGERVVLRSEAGRITVLRLPAAQGGGQTTLQVWARGARNTDLRWFVMALAADNPKLSSAYPEAGVGPGSGGTSPGWSRPLTVVPGGDLRALFEALDDPTRFAAAHAVLTSSAVYSPWSGPGNDHGVYRDAPRRQITAVFNGMRLDLPPGGGGWNADPFFAAVYHGPAAGYDPAQIPALRAFWFDRLAVPAGSVRHGVLMAATTFAPILWLALRARRPLVRRRRRRLGKCLRCGYDLRGNASGRCSECGAAIEHPAREEAG